MFKLKSKKANCVLELPTELEELTGDVLKSILEKDISISIPDHYAIIALCQPISISTINMAARNMKTDETVKVIPMLVDYNESTDWGKFLTKGDKIIINRSDIELGTQIYLPNCTLSFSYIAKYLHDDPELSKAIALGRYRKDGTIAAIELATNKELIKYPEVFLLSFKIVPIASIKASYRDRFKEDCKCDSGASTKVETQNLVSPENKKLFDKTY